MKTKHPHIQYYSPFGVTLSGRSWSGESYRYGYGSHEKIDEGSGSFNTVDMGDRWLDTRLGRTPKMDALAAKYPFISPYSYAANNPLLFIDPNGKEIVIATGEKDESGAAIKIVYKPGMSTEGMNEFTANTVTALNYIHQHGEQPDGYNKVQKLVDYSQNLLRQESNDWDRTSRFSPELNQSEPGTIYFNDNWGDQLTNGIQSPTVTLAHEIDHAWRFIYYIANYDVSGKDSYWDKAQEFYCGGEPGSATREAEELRAIKGLETRRAESLEQATRTEYSPPISIFYTDDVLQGTPSEAPAEVQEQIDTTNRSLSGGNN